MVQHSLARVLEISSHACQLPHRYLLCAVAIHIMDGLYTVSSLNASTYSLTIVCTSRQNAADFAKLVHALKAALDQARPDDTVYAFTKEQLVN